MSEIAQLRTGFVASVPIYYPPSALNVKVKKFIEARVNGGSNYDSLKVAKCLVI